MSAPIYYELRNGQMQVAYPAFIDGTRLTDLFAERKSPAEAERGNSGYLEDVNRRQELVKLVLQAREFDQAIVNRMWAYFFGYGFTPPTARHGAAQPAVASRIARSNWASPFARTASISSGSCGGWC